MQNIYPIVVNVTDAFRDAAGEDGGVEADYHYEITVEKKGQNS
jgi:hypothetical protein